LLRRAGRGWSRALKAAKRREVGAAVGAAMRGEGGAAGSSCAASAAASALPHAALSAAAAAAIAAVADLTDVALPDTPRHPVRAMVRAAQLLSRGGKRALDQAALLLDAAITRLRGGCGGACAGSAAAAAPPPPPHAWCWSRELHHALTMRGMVSSAALARSLRDGHRPGTVPTDAAILAQGRDAVAFYEAAAGGWIAWMDPQTLRFPLVSSSLPNAATACLQVLDLTCAERNLDAADAFDSENAENLKTRAAVLETQGRYVEAKAVRARAARAEEAAELKQWSTVGFDTAELWQGAAGGA
jgi:hypothetical protein